MCNILFIAYNTQNPLHWKTHTHLSRRELFTRQKHFHTYFHILFSQHLGAIDTFHLQRGSKIMEVGWLAPGHTWGLSRSRSQHSDLLPVITAARAGKQSSRSPRARVALGCGTGSPASPLHPPAVLEPSCSPSQGGPCFCTPHCHTW